MSFKAVAFFFFGLAVSIPGAGAFPVPYAVPSLYVDPLKSDLIFGPRYEFRFPRELKDHFPALPAEPLEFINPEEPFPVHIEAAPKRLKLSLEEIGPFQYIDANFNYSGVPMQQELPNFQQFADWLRRERVAYRDPLMPQEEGALKNFSFNLDAGIALGPKLHLRFTPFISRSHSFYSREASTFEEIGLSNTLTYQMNEYIQLTLGHDLRFSRFSFDGYRQENVSRVPNIHLDLRPLKNIRGFETLTLKFSGEMQISRSKSQTAGAGLYWDLPAQKIGNIPVAPHLAAGGEVRKISGGENIISQWLSVDASVGLTKNLRWRPFVSFRSEKSAGFDQKQLETGFDFKYRFGGEEHRYLLLQCTRTSPLSSRPNTREASTNLNAAVVLDF